MALLDLATMKHFSKWVNASVPERYKDATVDRILGLVSRLDDVDLAYVLANKTWPEIDRMAEAANETCRKA